ncbi:MAG: urease accessory protein UreD [Yoonia sp.]|nr:urease accessory protein UreD [Yoonia sp.]
MLDTFGSFQPRAKGRVVVSAKLRGASSVIDDLYQSGCSRVLFPRGGPALHGVLINTSGGVTGGDKIVVSAKVGEGSALTLTSQAAERAYRAQPNETGSIATDIMVAQNAVLHWLPQELILFDGSRLERTLDIQLAPTAKALLVEPVVFGRTAMGETLSDIHFSDRISITRGGLPVYLDGVTFMGDVSAQMAQAATGNTASAMASVIFVAPDAALHIAAIRTLLPLTGGATLLADDLLVVRLVAQDSFVLRQSLFPILERLSGGSLPATWRL